MHPSLGRADAVGKMAKKNSNRRIGANDFRTIDKHKSSPRKTVCYDYNMKPKSISQQTTIAYFFAFTTLSCTIFFFFVTFSSVFFFSSPSQFLLLGLPTIPSSPKNDKQSFKPPHHPHHYPPAIPPLLHDWQYLESMECTVHATQT